MADRFRSDPVEPAIACSQPASAPLFDVLNSLRLSPFGCDLLGSHTQVARPGWAARFVNPVHNVDCATR